MKIQTKKYQLDKNKYIKLSLKLLLRERWWVILLNLVLIGICIFFKSIVSTILSSILLIGYMLFWIIQFFGITQLEQSQLLFEKMMYEITSDQIMMKITPQKGMPVDWKQILKAYHKPKQYIILTLSRVQFIYLPYKIFSNEHEIQWIQTLLKRKKLLS